MTDHSRSTTDADEAVADATVDPIVVESVTKRYGEVLALDDVSLCVEPDTIHCLLGPNGSGKTTLFDLLLGLTRPTDGRIDRGEETIGCGFQEATFYPDLSVGENLSTFADMAGGVDADWRDRVVAELGLDSVDDRTAGDLSGGWAKRLDLALAVLERPAYVILDEPLDDLDDVVRRRVLAFFETYRDEGGTVLVATHRAAAFDGLADHVTVLDRGDVAVDAAVEDLERSLEAVYLDSIE